MTIAAPVITVVPLEQWTTLVQAPGMSEVAIINITQPGATTLPVPPQGTTFTSVYVNAAGAVQVTMPSNANALNPLLTGQRWLIKDTSGLAVTNNITINGNGYNLDNNASFTLNVNYGDVMLEWNGTAMSIVA